jgi:DNA-binding SARP family transcriptional activator
VHPEGRTREQIGLAFWPEISAAQVKNNFHVTLHHLRKALGGSDWIVFDRGRYRVAFEAGVRFDAAAFEARVVESLRTLRARPDDTAAATILAEALEGYRGHLLDEESMGDWHLEWRDRLARLHEDALLALGASHAREGRHAEAAEAYRRLATMDPLHEEAVHALMLALARDNRRSEALRAFERLAQELRREMDAEPSAELLTLATELRTGAPV